MSIINAMPFLAEHRLVIVQGLLSKSNPPDRQRAGSSATPRRRKGSKEAAQWDQLPDAVKVMPPTTVLVFEDGALHRDNSLLKALAPEAQVKTFEPLRGASLQRWIRGTSLEHAGGQISERAVSLLSASFDGSLWRLAGDIEKLTLYAAGRAVDEPDVRKLVNSTQDSNIFAMVDAVIQGNRTRAFRQLSALMDDGISGFHILTMIGRQLRLIALAIDLRARRVPPSEFPKHLGMSSRFALDKVMDQASTTTLPAVTQAYENVLNTDLQLKSTDMPEGIALEMLVGDLSTTLHPKK